MRDPLDQPLAAIAAQLAEGRINARALVEAAQARHDPALNAYQTWAPDFACRQATAADAAFAAGVLSRAYRSRSRTSMASKACPSLRAARVNSPIAGGKRARWCAACATSSR